MATITVAVTDNATDRLGRITASARDALERVIKPLTREVYEDVLARAAAHIHTQGTKPGLYLASIGFGTYDKDRRLGGYVRSGSPLAHLLELGAKPGPHAIQAKAVDVLKFSGSAGDVFRHAVQFPGATIPPYPAFGPAMEAHATEIRDTLIRAVREAAAKP